MILRDIDFSIFNIYYAINISSLQVRFLIKINDMFFDLKQNKFVDTLIYHYGTKSHDYFTYKGEKIVPIVMVKDMQINVNLSQNFLSKEGYEKLQNKMINKNALLKIADDYNNKISKIKKIRTFDFF